MAEASLPVTARPHRSRTNALETPGEAFEGIQRLVEEAIHDLEANGEPVPEALADRTYSGQFVVRVPPEVHRQLVSDAAEQQVSLNRLVSSRLAS